MAVQVFICRFIEHGKVNVLKQVGCGGGSLMNTVSGTHGL